MPTTNIYIYIYNSALKRLIASKKVFVHNISVCTVFMYYVYINRVELP